MLLMNLSDPVEQLANFGILAFLGVVMAFFHGQKFPGKLILQIVEILGGQLQPSHSFPCFTILSHCLKILEILFAFRF